MVTQNNFKVKPNLSITGKELKERLRNKTIKIADGGKMYNQDLDIEEARKLGKIENARRYLRDIDVEITLKNKIAETEKAMAERSKLLKANKEKENAEKLKKAEEIIRQHQIKTGNV